MGQHLSGIAGSFHHVFCPNAGTSKNAKNDVCDKRLVGGLLSNIVLSVDDRNKLITFVANRLVETFRVTEKPHVLFGTVHSINISLRQPDVFAELPLHTITDILEHCKDQDGDSLTRTDELVYSIPGGECTVLYLTKKLKATNAALTYATIFTKLNRTITVQKPFLVKVRNAKVIHSPTPDLHATLDLSTIREIVITAPASFSDRDADLILSKCSPSAWAVSFSGTAVGDATLRSIAARLGNTLVYLNLANCPNITDAGVSAVARHCAKLRYLYLNGNHRLTYYSYQAIYDGVPSLTDLGCFCSCATSVSVPDDVRYLDVEFTNRQEFGPWPEHMYSGYGMHHPHFRGKRASFKFTDRDDLVVCSEPLLPDDDPGSSSGTSTGDPPLLERQSDACVGTNDGLPYLEPGDALLAINGWDTTRYGRDDVEIVQSLFGREMRRGARLEIKRQVHNAWARARGISRDDLRKPGCSFLIEGRKLKLYRC